MSYILDALKKSDQQRQRGATPTLQAAQLTVAAPRRPLLISYGLPAAVLLATGIMIGWLRPWQAQRPLPASTPGAAEAVAAKPIPVSQPAASPKNAPPEVGRTAQGFPAPNPTQAGQAFPTAVANKPDSPAPVNSAEPHSGSPSSGTSNPATSGAAPPIAVDPARPDSAAQQQKALRIDELPVQIQREIPAMAVQLHAYSNLPSERIVYINSTRLLEGEYLMPGLMLEKITPDGMIFSYKGYRFQHGIR